MFFNSYDNYYYYSSCFWYEVNITVSELNITFFLPPIKVLEPVIKSDKISFRKSVIQMILELNAFLVKHNLDQVIELIANFRCSSCVLLLEISVWWPW